MYIRKPSPIPAHVQEVMAQLIDHLWDDERLDYSFATAELRKQHIFRAVVILKRFLFDPTGETNAFGGCPECGSARQNDGYKNIGRGHWFFCEIHRLKWCAGSNLISTWRLETESDWRENYSYLEDFAEVDPIQ